jgi:hypothetical protein
LNETQYISVKAAKQIPSGIKSEISYTPEDGHVGRNMQCEHRQQNARASTIKLHADGNLTSKLIEQYSAAGC